MSDSASNQDANVAATAITNTNTAGDANLPPVTIVQPVPPSQTERISDVQTTNLNNENSGQV